MTPKRVLLVNPPTGLMVREDRCQASVANNPLVMRPPIDLLYVAAVLEARGCVCKLQDYPVLGQGWEAFKNDLLTFTPDALVISTTVSTLRNDLKAAELAKSFNKEILTIAKGPHFLVEAERTLNEHPYLDVAVHGESELPISECVMATDLSAVKGITYADRRSGKAVRTPEAPFTEDLDALPLPARHLIDNSVYVRPDTLEPQTTIQTARGCPWSCIYCLSPVAYGKKVRQRSPESLVAEVEHCVERYGIRNFVFLADTFTWNKDWILRLCRLMAKKGLDVNWACNSRVNTLDEERIQWMKKAGCWLIAFGVESGNDEHLRLMKKGTSTKEAKPAIDLCRRYGVRSYAYFIFGLPWETRESAEQTIRFAKELDPDIAEFYTAYPFPGTEYARLADEMGLYERKALDDTHLGGYESAVVRTPALSAEEIENFSRRARFEFYARPRYVLREIATIRSFRQLHAHGIFGYQLVRGLIASKLKHGRREG